MSVNTNDIFLDTSTHFQIHRTKLRTVGTFLVPIVAMVVFYEYYYSFLHWLGFDYVGAANRIGDIKWGIFSFNPFWITNSFIVKFFVLVITFAVLYRNEKIFLKDVGLVCSLGKINLSEILLLNMQIVFFAVLFLFFAVNMVYYFLGSEFLHDFIYYLNQHQNSKKLNINDFGPLFEEIIFRGVCCTLLVRHGWKWFYAILLTGVIFGLIHLVEDYSNLLSSVVQVVFATFCGWFLGWIFYRTRTLALPIFWHYLINFFIYFTILRPDIVSKISNYLIL